MQRYSSNSYTKYTVILLGVAVVAVFLSAAAFSMKHSAVQAAQQSHIIHYSSKPGASQENAASETAFRQTSSLSELSPSPSADPAKQESYLVTVYQGKIGVFEAGKREPFLTADIDVYLLPEEDIALLKAGIPAESLAQVRGILEDYE